MEHLTVEDVLKLIADRVNWCRENGESDMRNIRDFVSGIRASLKSGKTRAEILADYADEDDDD